jgi:hypothetical protein
VRTAPQAAASRIIISAHRINQGSMPDLSAPAANAQQQPTIFSCAAPAGHGCRFAVQTGAAPIDFALPSGERKLVPGLVPYQAKYCVCDPGPVTPDCRAPRMDHWCPGQWLAVVPGVNSQIDGDRRFALR